MKIDWGMLVTVALAIVVAGLLDKFVLSKIESYDEFGSYDGEEYQ